MDRPEPLDPNPITRPGAEAGEVAASTGGVVDLDRIIGNIPVIFVFLPEVGPEDEPEQAEIPPGHPANPENRLEPTLEVMRGLGHRLVEFGRERIQVLGVHRSDAEEVIVLGDEADSTARIISDPDGRIADAFGVVYDDLVHVVVVGPDGDVVDRWNDEPAGTLADRVLEHTAALGYTG